MPTTRNISDLSTIITWGPVYPREAVSGTTSNFTTAQTLRIDVGRRRIYANRATFLDILGIAQVESLADTIFRFI